jgi:hypothetical protein
MQHLEVSGAVVLYIGRTVSKGFNEKQTLNELRVTWAMPGEMGRPTCQPCVQIHTM